MKTFAEVAAWCAGAAEQFGDPSKPICQIFLRWHDKPLDAVGDELLCGWQDRELLLRLGPDFLPLSLPLQKGEPDITPLGELQTFGADCITPGVWSIAPSLNAPGVIHAFLILYGVPNPAPWESLIVLI